MLRRRPRVPLAEDAGHSGKRWAGLAIAAALVVVTGIGVVLARDDVLGLLRPRCQATALEDSVTFSPEQMHHAATITAIAMKRGLPARAATVALATSIQESKLRNITYGDRDSLGLFQQRPSQGWGTEDEILDPVHATNAFYDQLVKVDGYQDMEITQVAQLVQRSAFPEAYADHEREARIIASTLTGYSPGGLGCRLDPTKGATDRKALVTALREELGVSAERTNGTLVVRAPDERHAWGIGAWAVAQAEAHQLTSVTVGDRQWTRTRRSSGWSWHDADDPQDPTTVLLRLTTRSDA